MSNNIQMGDYVIWNDRDFRIPYNLTKDKEYLVIDFADNCYTDSPDNGIIIITDIGESDIYRSSHFTTRIKLRNNLIDNILK